MSQLMPERRFDKNGKAVTRHVRSSTGKQPSASIPPPSSTPNNPERVALINHVREAMVRGNHGFKRLRPVASIYASLDRFSDATVDAYVKAITDDPKRGFDELLIGVLNADTPGNEANYLLEIAKLDTTGATFTDDVGRRYCEVAKQAYLGLGCYSEMGYSAPEDITDKSDPDTVKVLGLLHLTIRLFMDDESGVGITGDMTDYGVGMKVDSDEVARLALERPHDADRIAAAIMERGTMDVEVVKEMLDSGSVNLQNGVL